MSHIFISHSHKDAEAAERIRKILEKVNRVAWVAGSSLIPSAPWAEKIDEALRKAAAVLVVMTPNARKSEYVTYEWSFALGADKPVVPLFVEDSTLHPCLDRRQGVDFRKGWKSWHSVVEQLLDDLPPGEKVAATPGPADPTIVAEFDRDKRCRLVRNGPEYQISLWVENVPEGSRKKVKYEILYPGFKHNPWREKRGKGGEYRTWISSYGNVPITVDGKGEQGCWSTGTSLYDALCRHYGDSPSDDLITKAIEDIRDN